MSAASARVSGNWQMSTRVAWASAEIGLKLRLPQSLSQISARMSLVTGARKPALIRVWARDCTRGDIEPSSSPRPKRWPSTTCTTPGSVSTAAG